MAGKNRTVKVGGGFSGPEAPIASLTLIVDYDQMPALEDVEKVVDEAKALGRIRSAILGINKPHTIDLS